MDGARAPNDVKDGFGRVEKIALGRDLLMVLLAIVSVGMLVYDELVDLPTGTREALIQLDWMMVAVFVGEFVYRLWRSDSKARFLRRNWWEIPGMVPMAWGNAGYLRLLRLLRLARLWRIVRVVNVVAELRHMNRRAGRFVSASGLPKTATLAAVIVVLGAVLVWLLDAGNPRFERFSEALWWAVVTVTTVGYGDVVPQSPAARAVATALMFVGIGLIGVLSASIAQALLRPKEAEDTADPPQEPLVDALERLARLRQAGSLSEGEFTAAKSKLLGV